MVDGARIRGSRLFCVVTALSCMAAAPGARAASDIDWLSWSGPEIGNQRAAIGETILNVGNVGKLMPKWVFVARGNVGATPTVEGNNLYVTDDGGGIYRINAQTGQAIWAHAMSDFTGNGGSSSRSSPAIAGQLVIVADRHTGAVVALDKLSGKMVWQTVIETNPYTKLTASPTVYGSTVYLGTASAEEYVMSVSSGYVASFRGSVVALSLATGAIKWKTSMVPEGYTGGAVWGSGFAISPMRNMLYAATGNNYSVTQAATNCLQTAQGSAAQLACLDPADNVDAVVALDLTTGAIRWSHRLQGADTFNLNCTSATPAQPCPIPTGPDWDFASAPNIIGSGTHQFVGAGQKSGIYWALDPDTGAQVWATMAGPGAGRGGIMWGSAVGAGHVYVAENNASRVAYTLGPRGTKSTTGGSWAALDVQTGAIRWQVAVEPATASVSGAEGVMTFANGVVYGGTTSGDMVAMDAATGRTLWRFASGGSVTCGPAVAAGMVYWGSGDPYGISNNQLYAFALPGSAGNL